MGAAVCRRVTCSTNGGSSAINISDYLDRWSPQSRWASMGGKHGGSLKDMWALFFGSRIERALGGGHGKATGGARRGPRGAKVPPPPAPTSTSMMPAIGPTAHRERGWHRMAVSRRPCPSSMDVVPETGSHQTRRWREAGLEPRSPRQESGFSVSRQPLCRARCEHLQAALRSLSAES